LESISDDWRLPSAKELFSLSDFEEGGPFLDTDHFEFPDGSVSTVEGGPQRDGGPQGNSEDGRPQGGAPQDGEISEEDLDSEEQIPPPPTDTEGDEDSVSKAEGQFWSSNFYEVGTTHDGAPTAFGVNHATGHIKGYPSDVGGMMGKYVRAVRGDAYGASYIKVKQNI
jgi:hypothetical protein